MAYKAVIGLGFGDEGKGLMTDYLCSQATQPLVVRFSGGQQAGHTVVAEGIRHVFSNFGSGTLKGAASYFSPYCTIEPVGLINELSTLLDKGIAPCLFIDGKCPITTPHDIYANQQNAAHGSCGVGVGDTLNREENFYSLTFADLAYPWVLASKLQHLKAFYPNTPPTLAFTDFLECCDLISHSPYINLCHDLPSGYSDIIFEGSQGLLLDQHYGFFPHVTRANTGSKNIVNLVASDDIAFFLITRAYQTRHGNGPMSNEHIPHTIYHNPAETNVSNRYQGEFRRTLLDVSLLEYAIHKDDVIRRAAHKTLVITCVDHIQNEYRFTYQGHLVYCENESDFIHKVAKILRINTVYVSAAPDSAQLRQVVI
jgi:adenylosuccinate synthase